MSLESYPSRQRTRRLTRALRSATAALAAVALAAVGFRAGLGDIAALFLLVGAASTLRCRHWLRLARLSTVGACSEQQVRAKLEGLEQEGWLVRHSLGWHGGGDVDHVAITPRSLGLVFAIETKTRTYTSADLARIAAVARWQAQRRSGRRRTDAIPILCLAGTCGIERWESGVAVVSLERLLPVMSRLAGTTPKPGFLR